MILVSCENLAFILRVVGYLFKIVQWAIPMLLIALITIDVFRGMIAGDEKKSKEAVSRAGKRLVYALILFLIPLLVRMLFRAIDDVHFTGYGSNDNSATSWISCFNEFFK